MGQQTLGNSGYCPCSGLVVCLGITRGTLTGSSSGIGIGLVRDSCTDIVRCNRIVSGIGVGIVEGSCIGSGIDIDSGVALGVLRGSCLGSGSCSGIGIFGCLGSGSDIASCSSGGIGTGMGAVVVLVLASFVALVLEYLVHW